MIHGIPPAEFLDIFISNASMSNQNVPREDLLEILTNLERFLSCFGHVLAHFSSFLSSRGKIETRLAEGLPDEDFG